MITDFYNIQEATIKELLSEFTPEEQAVIRLFNKRLLDRISEKVANDYVLKNGFKPVEN